MALYGKDVASYPIRMKFLFLDKSKLIQKLIFLFYTFISENQLKYNSFENLDYFVFDSEASGQKLSLNIHIFLMDQYNQTIQVHLDE